MISAKGFFFVTGALAKSVFLVVQSNRARAVKIVSDLRYAVPNSTVRHAMDLKEACRISEDVQPDLVLLDESMVHDHGLTMFISMLSALAVDWAMVVTDQPLSRIPPARQVRIDMLAPYLRGKLTGQAQGTAGFDGQRASRSPAQEKETEHEQRWKTVVIGASTGGIEALIALLSDFPIDAPPTLIVQHINGAFVPGLAERLNRLCAASVRTARGNEPLEPGQIFLAPGQTQHLEVSSDGRQCQLSSGSPRNGHRPSVDVLFSSAARALGPRAVGVLLSGMGRDGAAGLLDIRQGGGWTIGQDKETSVVYGMPRVAMENGAVQQQLPVSKIGEATLAAAMINRKKFHDA